MSHRATAALAPIHTYNNGQPYKLARCRAAPRDIIESRLPPTHAVVTGRPTTEAFLHAIQQTLKIRMYASNSQANYLNHVRGFLQWHGNLPHTINRQDVCNYLELLVDGGASSSHLSVCLSAIRTCFDKFCGRDITLGLASPRKAKRQPVVPSTDEVFRIINAAPTRAAKLAIGILYAAGLRNSELCRLQVRDIDFQRKTIRIYQGKGCSDRLVMLPETYHRTLAQMCHDNPANTWLFPSLQHRTGRHMSPRTLQRWVAIAADFAGVKKRITPHSFRHAFATHLLENGTDIRFIQKLLGHQRLETTTIYTKVAQINEQIVRSPIDRLIEQTKHPTTDLAVVRAEPNAQQKSNSNSVAANSPVGKLKIHFKKIDKTTAAKVTLEILGSTPGINQPQAIFLTGIRVQLTQRNWIQLTMPEQSEWSESLRNAPQPILDRINSAEFYETIRQQICQRYITLF